jgi:hypothetical protein
MIRLDTGIMPARHGFSSVYIPITGSLAEAILTFGEDSVGEGDLFIDNETQFYGREDEPHITVAYGMHADSPEEIARIFEKHLPFTVTLGQVDMFNRMEFDVLIIRVHGRQLHELHHEVMKATKTTSKFKYYEPHCTLAYIQKGKCKDMLGDETFVDVELEVEKLVFSNKVGVKTTLPLGKRPSLT